MNQNNLKLGEQLPGPWPFWTTIIFSVIIVIILILVQAIVVVAFMATHFPIDSEIDVERLSEEIESNGLIFSIATIAIAPFVIGLILFFSKLRKGITTKEYLGVNPVARKTILKWIIVLIILLGLSDVLTLLLGRNICPDFMLKVYETAGFLPVLWLAVVVVAPLTEELFFRGFLFEGIRNSRLGPIAAVFITSLIWSMGHSQYDAYGILTIFLFGIFLGVIRIKSNSILLPILMHSAASLIAMLETAIFVSLSAR